MSSTSMLNGTDYRRNRKHILPVFEIIISGVPPIEPALPPPSVRTPTYAEMLRTPPLKSHDQAISSSGSTTKGRNGAQQTSTAELSSRRHHKVV